MYRRRTTYEIFKIEVTDYKDATISQGAGKGLY
jgi:hypothetical protein